MAAFFYQVRPGGLRDEGLFHIISASAQEGDALYKDGRYRAKKRAGYKKLERGYRRKSAGKKGRTAELLDAFTLLISSVSRRPAPNQRAYVHSANGKKLSRASRICAQFPQLFLRFSLLLFAPPPLPHFFCSAGVGRRVASRAERDLDKRRPGILNIPLSLIAAGHLIYAAGPKMRLKTTHF